MLGVSGPVCENDEVDIPEGVMMCSKPYEAMPGRYVGCGQCMYCRINRSRVWQHRMMLEAMSHDYSAFVTLTYDDDNVPLDGNLDPSEMQRFLKRIRRRYEPKKIRYYGVGEYGDMSWRPHYHLALFGVCVTDENVVEESWPKGFVYLGELTSQSARYMTNYVTKGLSVSNSVTEEKLQGRTPEFARMSLKPGLGVKTIEKIAEDLEKYKGDCANVIGRLHHGVRSLPLGRYLESKLCELRGVTDVEAWYESRIRQYSDNLEYVAWLARQSMEVDGESKDNDVDSGGTGFSSRRGVYNWIMDENEAKRRTATAKRRFFHKGRIL